MKILSLFDGISGTQQAFKNLGIEFDGKDNIYFSSEIDKYAIQITQKNFPNTAQLGNIKKLDMLQYEPEYEGDIGYHIDNMDWDNNFTDGNKWNCSEIYGRIDLLSFGFPCQDLSIAKRNGQGLEGERSGLFYEALRILKEVKPKYFIAENVASMKKKDKEIITQELFGIEPIMINSALLTAQTRKRLYWCGRLKEDGTYEKIEISQPKDKGIMLKDILENGNTEKLKSYCITATYSRACPQDYFGHGQRQLVWKTDNITQIEIDSLKAFFKNKKDLKNKILLNTLEISKYKDMLRKLTSVEIEKLQGFPDNFTEGISQTQRYECLGNSFTVPVIEHILKEMLGI